MIIYIKSRTCSITRNLLTNLWSVQLNWLFLPTTFTWRKIKGAENYGHELNTSENIRALSFFPQWLAGMQGWTVTENYIVNVTTTCVVLEEKNKSWNIRQIL